MNVDDARRRTNLSNIIAFYKEQIKKFYKIGIGNKTEFRTIVTDNLINTTKRRLKELQDKKVRLIKRSNNGVKWWSLCSVYVY